MQLHEAQADLRRGYVGGGPGVIISGLVWGAAAVIEARSGSALGFAALFLGGMLIFPLSLFTARALLRRAGAQKGNGLTPIAIESTASMIAGLFAAYLFLSIEPRLVFPIAALAVGAHYFAFRTLYGEPLFVALGALIAALGLNGVFSWVVLPGGLLWWVACVEILAGVILTAKNLRP
jgi:hypothetical protein